MNFELNSNGNWQLDQVTGYSTVNILGQVHFSINPSGDTTLMLIEQSNLLTAFINNSPITAMNDTLNPNPVACGLLVSDARYVPSSQILFTNFAYDTWPGLSLTLAMPGMASPLSIGMERGLGGEACFPSESPDGIENMPPATSPRWQAPCQRWRLPSGPQMRKIREGTSTVMRQNGGRSQFDEYEWKGIIMTAAQQGSFQEALTEAFADLQRCRERIAAIRRQQPREVVQDYVFAGPNGRRVSLSSLFGDKSDLILIHNMGSTCSYCTLWADGYNGVLPHLQDRAAFAVISPDDPDTQARFAQSRDWRFPLFSGQGTTFTADMGFMLDDEQWPGISTFRKERDGTITRGDKTFIGPGDDFCAVWHLFDLLPDGPNGWEPQFTYHR